MTQSSADAHAAKVKLLAGESEDPGRCRMRQVDVKWRKRKEARSVADAGQCAPARPRSQLQRVGLMKAARSRHGAIMSSLFFYGTLMVPEVLSRVIGRKGSGLKASDAILEGHTRHHVKGEGPLACSLVDESISSRNLTLDADYPAVVSAAAGSAILGRELTPLESSVRGTLVTGLTAKDVEFLDEFEGDVSTNSFGWRPCAEPVGQRNTSGPRSAFRISSARTRCQRRSTCGKATVSTDLNLPSGPTPSFCATKPTDGSVHQQISPSMRRSIVVGQWAASLHRQCWQSRSRTSSPSSVRSFVRSSGHSRTAGTMSTTVGPCSSSHC